MTSEEHVAMAEHYADIFDKTWRAVCDNPMVMGPTTEVDAMINDNLLHAAEVHLKLAEAKSRATAKVRDGMMSC